VNNNNEVLNFVKNTWFLPVIILLLLALLAIKKFDLSLTDYLADKVIRKLEADYNPYGPDVPIQHGPDIPIQPHRNYPDLPLQPRCQDGWLVTVGSLLPLDRGDG